MNMNRGINFKRYKSLILNLIDGNTEGMERKEYKKAIIESFVNEMDKNWLGGHVYEDMVELDYHNTGYIGKIKIHLDEERDSPNHKFVSFEFIGDCVVFSDSTIMMMYLKY